MKKKVLSIAFSGIFIFSMFFGSFMFFSNEAKATGTTYKKTPVNLDDPCYGSGGNCAEAVTIKPDDV